MAKEQVTLRAPDISCGHCVNAIKQAVTALPSVEFADGDPSTKTVRLSYDPAAVSLDQIKGAMAEEGYPVAA